MEGGERVEQRGDGAGRHHADRDPAPDQSGDVVDRAADARHRREHGPGVLEGRRAGRGERGAAARPVDQRRAEVAFQLPDLRADPGLADVDALRGAGEVRFLGDGDEVLQLPQFHTSDSSYQKNYLLDF